MMRSDMDKQVQGPNAPEGRGYNREGFRGRGPMAARPGEGGRGPVAPAPTTPGPISGDIPRTDGMIGIPRGEFGAVSAPTAQVTPMVASGTPRRAFKKGGMVSKGKGTSISTKGQGRSSRTKPCKIY